MRDELQPKGDASDPQGFVAMRNEFLDWLTVHNYSDRTIEGDAKYLDYFIDWANQRGLARPAEVTKPILERYQRFLFHYRKANGDPLAIRSQVGHVIPLRAWFKWLTRQNHILYNPASELDLPRMEKRLPKNILTAAEAEQVINLPDVNVPLGIRDRAILETLYSTGIRRMEIAALSVYGVDAERGTLTIRQGKGKKDRIVPIGDRALAWIGRYVHEVRPGLLVGDKARDTLFLTYLGLPFELESMSQLVRDFVADAQLGKSGSCHLFRHTMATLMLEGGADIRFIQAMLGHSDLNTTSIYTQVSIRKLKEIHTATHPAKIRRKNDKQDLDTW